MATDVILEGNAKIVLDFWTSTKGKKNEYLTARRFYGGRDGKFYPQKTNGMYLSIEDWEAMIEKVKEMIYYKTAPSGAPPYEDRIDRGGNKYRTIKLRGFEAEEILRLLSLNSFQPNSSEQFHGGEKSWQMNSPIENIMCGLGNSDDRP